MFRSCVMGRIWIVSTARSRSVCLTRVIDQLRKYKIFHEATVPVYDKIHYPDLTEDWFTKESFTDVASIKEAIPAHGENVLFKEMVFTIRDIVWDLVDTDNDKIIFMYRNPKDVAISFANKHSDVASIFGVDEFVSLCGHISLKELHSEAKARNVNCVMICTDDVISAITQVFEFLDEPFDREYLTFRNEGIEHIHLKWSEQKVLSMFEHWHKEALLSNEVIPSMGSHSIEEIPDEDTRKFITAVVQKLEGVN